MCERVIYLKEVIIIHGNQATCSMNTVCEWNWMVLACHRLRIDRHFHISNKRMCVRGEVKYYTAVLTEMYKSLLSKAKQYGGETWG